jgi:hypothetical protein
MCVLLSRDGGHDSNDVVKECQCERKGAGGERVRGRGQCGSQGKGKRATRCGSNHLALRLAQVT